MRSKMPKLDEVHRAWDPKPLGAARRNDWRVAKAGFSQLIASQQAERNRRLNRQRRRDRNGS